MLKPNRRTLSLGTLARTQFNTFLQKTSETRNFIVFVKTRGRKCLFTVELKECVKLCSKNKPQNYIEVVLFLE